jgi:antitoxin component YwqK of YwqJK toxin-antitoxin module
MRKSIEPINNKGQRHGLWELYFKGNLIYKGFFHNDKLVGYTEYYSGKSSNKTYYL